MERDFLGLHGKDSKEENRGRRHDSGGSPFQWPFSSNLASMQQLMPFKRPHEDGAKIVQFDKHHSSSSHPISTVDSFEAIRKPSPVLLQQRRFSLEQYMDSLGAAKHPSDGAIPASVHFLGSNVGSYAPRNVANSLPTTAQLTIFYAGSVNVYDDIPLDKAQAIMFLASAGSSNVLNRRPETPFLDSNKGSGPDSISTNANKTHTPTHHATPSCSGLSSPISINSQNAMHSASSSINATTEMMAPTTDNNQNELSKTVGAPLSSRSSGTDMARAVPQARRASLARFLEKRKERVTNTMPYSCTKKSPEEVVVPEKADFRNKPSSPDVALSSNMEHTWQLGQSKNSMVESGESPSTKLEI